MTNRKKKKKRNNSPCKQDEATRMNVFFRNMKEVLALYDCEQVVDLIDRFTKIALYRMRRAPLRVYQGNCTSLSKEQLAKIGDLLNLIMHDQKLPLKTGGPEISLHQYLTTGQSLRLIEGAMQKDEFKNGKAITELLLTRLNLEEAEKTALTRVNLLCTYVPTLFTSLARDVITVEPRIPDKPHNNHYCGLELYIHTHKAQVHYFNLEQHRRPAFRIGLTAPEGRIRWISIERTLFDHLRNCNKRRLPVYVQTHTLQRLTERLDLFSRDFFYFYLCTSIDRPRVTRHANHYLIEMEIVGNKAGYLVADVIGNKVLIKTFLFLPSEGTPEGEKLKKLSGLSKVDMQYWTIDRLSTFYHSDLRDKPEMKQLFCDAGCESIFRIVPTNKANTSQHIPLADCLINYIQLHQKQEEEAIAG